MDGLVNPIVNNSGDDPSTAWQNPSRTEWTLIGNQVCDGEGGGAGGGAPIYGSTVSTGRRVIKCLPKLVRTKSQL
jgi:hypothetical protein